MVKKATKKPRKLAKIDRFPLIESEVHKRTSVECSDEGSMTCNKADFIFVGIGEAPFSTENERTTWKIAPESDHLRVVAFDAALRFRGRVGIHPRFLAAADAASARSPRFSAWGLDPRPP